MFLKKKSQKCSKRDVEPVALDLLEMEGHGYDRFGDGERDNYQIDYRRIVGDMEPARPRISNREGEQPHTFGAYTHPTPHGHGHETAAQRYSATRIQAGYEPERSVSHSSSIKFALHLLDIAPLAESESFSLSSSICCALLQVHLSATWATNQILLARVLQARTYSFCLCFLSGLPLLIG